MPDDANPADPNAGNNNGSGDGTDPSKKTETPQPPEFDAKKLGDDDFNKVFDDPRIFNHPRFKSLNERAKKLDEFEKAEEARKAEEMKKKGEFEALAKTESEKREAAELKLKNALIDNKITVEATKNGAGDVEAVLKLIDRSTVSIDDSDAITGVEDAVKALLENKPYLKGSSSNTVIGSETNPGANQNSGIKKFKMSEIQDVTFYQANEKDILAAIAAGQVENDMGA